LNHDPAPPPEEKDVLVLDQFAARRLLRGARGLELQHDFQSARVTSESAAGGAGSKAAG